MSTIRYFLVLWCFFAMISLFGPVTSEEIPFITTMVSGGELTINESGPGNYLVQIQNTFPNATIMYDNKSVEVPLSYAFPLNICTVTMNITDESGEEKIYLVQANNIRFFEENKSLVYEAIPQEFSDIAHLISDQTKIHEIKPGLFTLTNVSFANIVPAAENSPYNYCCTFEQMDNHQCVPARPLCGY